MNKVSTELQSIQAQISALQDIQKAVTTKIERLQKRYTETIINAYIPNIYGDQVAIDEKRSYMPYATWSPKDDTWIGVVEEYENGEPFGDEGRPSTWENGGVFETAEQALEWAQGYIMRQLATAPADAAE